MLVVDCGQRAVEAADRALDMVSIVGSCLVGRQVDMEGWLVLDQAL